jgi:hypothetical protein
MTAKTLPAKKLQLGFIGSIPAENLKQPNEGTVMLIPEEFIAPYVDQAALVINVSGGKDGTRKLGLLRSQFPSGHRI